MADMESLVWYAVTKWARPGGPGGFNSDTTPSYEDRQALIALITEQLSGLPESHTVRDLRWTVKNLGKQNGKQAQKIYDLRCQLAEVRGLTQVDRTGYRALRDKVAEQAEEIRELKEKWAALETAAEEGVMEKAVCLLQEQGK